METLEQRLERVREKLSRLDRPKIFGASSHGCVLGPPLAEAQVATFEREHGITLPGAYRGFLTTIGHGGPGQFGGAGPFYGLTPLHHWDRILMEETKKPLSQPFPTVPGADYGKGEDWFERAGVDEDGEWYPGAIALADQGCGDMVALVVTGPARGRVAYLFWGRAPMFTADADFLAWYERWLDAALSGAEHWY
ncbi:SMI1/KNR4 family protein [Actinoplanes cyaneus]|nr:SMI1/KNR4 family protein [Actinoplanes cyaneus]MCW2139764.1 SMI1 / KNR4 family (SUKH-1) [Actinoplanes cyaneus]